MVLFASIMDVTKPIPASLLERLYRKLPSVHERLSNLPSNDKIHHVLHSAYWSGSTAVAGRNQVKKMTDIVAETEANAIPELLAAKNLKQLQKIDRLVKPDPRIYVHKGEAVSFDDIKTKKRSPIEASIQDQIKAINLQENPARLTHDLEKYGFAIIATTDTEKDQIGNAFEQAETYLKNTDLDSKKAFSIDNPSIDAKYMVPSKPVQNGNHYRPRESISAPRPFVFGSEHDTAWSETKASSLRQTFKDITNLLENKSQEVLNHLARLFQLKPDFFKESGYETDQSSLRLIHCISENETRRKPNSYYDDTTREKTPHQDELDHCVGIHTDWGLITLLPTATKEGLEFWYNDTENNGKNSGWVKLQSKPGELIVMPGNVAEIISGGKLKSVPHRVVSSGDRMSLAYFTEVKKDTNIDQLKSNFLTATGVKETVPSLFEDEVRPYLTSPEQTLTGENYLLYMLHRNTRGLNQKTRNYAQDQGLFLKG